MTPDIHDSIRYAICVSRRTGRGVRFAFNGVDLSVFPFSTEAQLYRSYRQEIIRLEDEAELAHLLLMEKPINRKRFSSGKPIHR